MAVVVTKLQASLTIDTSIDWAGARVGMLVYADENNFIQVTLAPTQPGTNRAWRSNWQTTSDSGDTGFVAGSEGTAEIILVANGADIQWETTGGGVTLDSGTWVGAASYAWDWDEIQLWGLNSGFDPEEQGLNHWTQVTYGDAEVKRWDWDAQAELDEWTIVEVGGYTRPQMASSWIAAENGANTQYLILLTLSPAVSVAVSACLQSPGIMRRVKTTDGALREEFAADGNWTAILASASEDVDPEVLYLGAPDSQLGLVWQRDSAIVGSVSNGVIAGGWGDVQTIRSGRAHPTACVIPPTHDLYVVGYQSDNIAKGQRCSWAGGSWTIGSEVTVVGSAVADGRGHVIAKPGGVLVFCYTDTAGDIQAVTSNDCGATWA